MRFLCEIDIYFLIHRNNIPINKSSIISVKHLGVSFIKKVMIKYLSFIKDHK